MGELSKHFAYTGRIDRRRFLEGGALLAASAAAAGLPGRALASRGPRLAEPKATWVSHYTYVAPDLAKTSEWYEEIFAMQVGEKNSRHVHLWYGDEGGDTLMIVRQATAGEAAPRLERFAFSVADWDRSGIEAALKTHGANPQSDSDRGFWFKDPDGNEVGVFADDYVQRPSGRSPATTTWKALSSNHIVFHSNDYRKLGDWYRDLLSLRETADGGRDVYLWFGDSVWIPTAVGQGGKTSIERNSLDHVAYTIADYDSAAVEAELRRRKMIEPDDDVTGSLGINCIDVNGFKTQICDLRLVSEAEQRRG